MVVQPMYSVSFVMIAMKRSAIPARELIIVQIDCSLIYEWRYLLPEVASAREFLCFAAPLALLPFCVASRAFDRHQIQFTSLGNLTSTCLFG